MSLSATLTLNFSDGGTNLIQTVTYSNDVINKLSTTVTSGAVKQAEAIAFVRTKVSILYCLVDTTTTLYTNSTVTPADTITLYPSIPLIYYTSMGITLGSIFTADVTTLYFSGAGTTTGNLNLALLKSA